jgi:TRAP-type mannitol/chloroaromatic compound transport system permease large subunit
VAPVRVGTLQIYRGVVPFIAIQLVGLLLICLFPDIVTMLVD